MDRERDFLKRLTQHEHVGIDTSPFIYHFEKHPKYSKLTTVLFQQVEKGHLKAVTSTLTLMEILVKPKQRGDIEAVEDYRFALKTFPNLALRAIDETCAEHASNLRSSYQIKPPDALQIATALSSHATGFVTNDSGLEKIRELDIIVLENYVSDKGKVRDSTGE